MNREDALLLQSLHICVALYLKQTVWTLRLSKPLISRVSNLMEDVQRVIVICVENESSLDIPAVNARRCQIRRANVSYFATVLIA